MKNNRDKQLFEHGKAQTIGVLLCNLGTPDAPDTGAVRRYLAEFLSDPRVVELPRLLWLPLLHAVILNIRPRRSAQAYQKIWTAEGSPLLTLSTRLGAAISEQLDAGGAIKIAVGMRYGNPSIASAIGELTDAGARRILVLPLYPQYACATTASIHDAVFDVCRGLRWLPQLRFVSEYHARDGYIAALASSVESHWREHGRGARLLMSFHGIPLQSFLAGDPYHCQCQATARLLAERLSLPDTAWQLSFQSRVGPTKWLEPYTEKTLLDWGAEKIGDIDVICPGFAVDCLETLEEIQMQNAERFREAGGGDLRYIPALNDRAEHSAFMAELITDELGSWPSLCAQQNADRQAAAQRARSQGGA